MITDEHGKGLVIQPPDPLAPTLLGAQSVVGDFSQSSGITPAPGKDQGSSGSCTAQAFGYYFFKKTGIDLSRQDLYSRYHLPGGGGYLTSPFDIMNRLGNYDLAQHADPSPETEADMIVEINEPDKPRRVFGVHFWTLTDQSIDGVAWAIDRFMGVVGGVQGTNSGWQDPVNPRPPASGDSPLWSHALYFYDHDMINGLKNVVAESSWFNTCDHHNIKENYFASGNTFSFIAMEVKEISIMEGVYTINYKGKIGFLDLSGRYPGGIFAANGPELLELQKMFNKEVLKPDGSYNPTDITL